MESYFEEFNLRFFVGFYLLGFVFFQGMFLTFGTRRLHIE